MNSKSLLMASGSKRQSKGEDVLAKDTESPTSPEVPIPLPKQKERLALESIEDRDFGSSYPPNVSTTPAVTVCQTVQDLAPSVKHSTNIGTNIAKRSKRMSVVSNSLTLSDDSPCSSPATPKRQSRLSDNGLKHARLAQNMPPANSSASSSSLSATSPSHSQRAAELRTTSRNGVDLSGSPRMPTARSFASTRGRSSMTPVRADTSDQLRAFTGNGRACEPYSGFKNDKWLLSPQGNTYVHLEDEDIATFRLDSRVINQLPFLQVLLENSPSAPRPLLDLDVLRQQRPGSLPLHQRISPIKWDGVLECNSSPDITSGLAMTNAPVYRIWSPRVLSNLFTENKQETVFRNILAMLYEAPAVGGPLVSVTDVLCDLAVALDYLSHVMDPDQLEDASSKSRDLLISYVQNLGYIDVSNDLRHATDMLMWCEHPLVRWEEGYRECFAQVVGMMSGHDWSDFMVRYTGPYGASEATTNMIFRGWSQLRLAVSLAESYLEHFKFDELLYTFRGPEYVGVRRAFDDFSRLVRDHYTSALLWWPPVGKSQMSSKWLTSGLAQQLTADFNTLYDALVDYDIGWEADAASTHPRLFWRFHANAENGAEKETPFIWKNMLRALELFDGGRKDKTMPLPLPLMPQSGLVASIPGTSSHPDSPRKRERLSAADQQRTAVIFRGAMHQEYLEDIEEPSHRNSLLAKLTRLEATAEYSSLSMQALQDARLGRWLLIYGVLQILNTLSVEGDYGALVEPRWSQESGARSYYIWGAVRANPPWLHYNGPVAAPPAHRGESTQGKRTVTDNDVFDFSRAREASHPWRRHAEVCEAGRMQVTGMSLGSPSNPPTLPPINQLTPRPVSEHFGRNTTAMPLRPSSAYIANSSSKFSKRRTSAPLEKCVSDQLKGSSMSLFGTLPSPTPRNMDDAAFEKPKKRGHAHTLSKDTWETVDTDGSDDEEEEEEQASDNEVSMLWSGGASSYLLNEIGHNNYRAN